MTRDYNYELWTGSKVVGHVRTRERLMGREVRFMDVGITVPISYRIVSDDGIDTLYRVVLDVRKKSKRQIAVLTTKEVQS